METRPDCYKCIYRRSIPGDEHSRCVNRKAIAQGDPYGIRRGWCCWPFNFDPIWMVSCTGFKNKEEDRK